MQIVAKRELDSQVSVLMSDKIDAKSKTSKRQRRMLYIDKRVNISRRYKSYKHICCKTKPHTI